MSYLRKRMVFPLGVFMLYACQPSEDLDTPAPVPLEIGMVQTAGIGLIDTRTATDADTRSFPDADTRSATGADTRATTYSNYPTTSGSYIGFYVKAVSGAYKEVTNRRGVYVPARKVWAPSSGGTDASADSIWLKEQTTNIAVYAPYAATQDTPGKLELTSRRIIGTEAQKAATDFLWYTRFEANRTNAHRSTLKLEHAYSRFTIRVSRVSYYQDPLQLGTLSLKSPGIYPAGKQVLLDLFAKPTPTYQLAEGAAGEFSIEVNEKMDLAPTIAENTQVVDIDLLMIPVTLTQYILLSLAVDGQNMKVALDKASFDGKFEAGKHYTLNLKLHPRELEVTGVTITDWETYMTLVGSKNDFEFHKEPGIHVPAEDIYLMVGNGICTDEVKQRLAKLVWAAGNLETAEGPKLVGGVMTFPPYEWTSRQYDPGYYYMWQSPYITTGKQDRVTTLDPCTLLDPDKYGTGWRLPNVDEMDDLLKCSMAGIYGTPNGQYSGRWCMREINGVFLTYSGRAQGSHVSPYSDFNNYGYYWCAEEYDRDMGLQYQIDRRGEGVNKSAIVKAAGNSVRCVKDYQPAP